MNTLLTFVDGQQRSTACQQTLLYLGSARGTDAIGPMKLGEKGMDSDLLRVEHLTKRFGNITALDDVSISVGQNEIVGLLGQNGAGKSTLTKILVGVEKPDSGTMTFRSSPFAPNGPLDAARKGISIAYQESSTVPDLKVFQWMFLGRELKNSLGMLKVGETKSRTASLLEELKISCSPDDRIGNLPAVTKKMVEVAKAIDISRKAQTGEKGQISMVILDEPTATLSDSERGLLFDKLKEMIPKSSFLLISHLVPEVLNNSDRIFVLRDGKNAGSFDLGSQNVEEQTVYLAMFGKEIAEIRRKDQLGAAVAPSELMLKATGISCEGMYSDVSFDVRKGEILSLEGAPHSGKSEIAKTIAGIIRHETGTIEKDGRVLKPGVGARIDCGIGYFSGERADELFLIWPVLRNISITVLDLLRTSLVGLTIIDPRKERDLAQKMVSRLGIQPNRTNALLRNLSGGNMQKVGFAKWLTRDPDLLILINPTAGIDTKTKMEIYEILLGMKGKGKALLLISDDVEEVNRLSDRILRVEDGRILDASPRGRGLN